MDHAELVKEGLLGRRKKRLEQLIMKNDRLVKEMLVALSKYGFDDIYTINTTAVQQMAAELHENQILAQALDKEVKEAEGGGR